MEKDIFIGLDKSGYQVNIFYALPFSMGVHIVSPLSVSMSFPSVRPVRNTNGFHAISFERIGVLD